MAEEKEKKQNVKLLVDQENGPYKQIQEAIEIAEPGSLIKIRTGVYRPITINKPNLKFMPLSNEDKVEIDGVEAPACIILLNKDEKVFFKGIQFETHSSKNDEEEMHDVSLDDMPLEEEEEIARKDFRINMQAYYLSKESPSVIYLGSGMVYMDKCEIRIRPMSFPRSFKIPAFVCFSDTTLKLVSCQIQGSLHLSTAGIVSFGSDVQISACTIYNHNDGGILIRNSETNASKISDCLIKENKFSGVYLEGPMMNTLIQKCKFESNEGAGIICSCGTYPRVLI